MTISQGICDLIHVVATIVQRHGQHDFPSYEHENDFRTASLCGLTVFFKNGHVIRMKARDMDLVFEMPSSDYDQHKFTQGSTIELERWHNRLSRFQTVFHFGPETAIESAV